jgi:group I intron endonuclease
MKKIGIYAICNTADGKRYIGQSIEVERRNKEHIDKLKCGKHHNQYLQSAFAKYGVDSFEFRILEEVEIGMLDVREREWIKYYKSDQRQFGYNLESGGNLYKKHSLETKRKISDAGKGRVVSAGSRLKASLSNRGQRRSKETRERISAACKGRVISTETRNKMALSHTGQHRSAETRQKMSLSGMGRHPSEETRQRLRDGQRRRHEAERTQEQKQSAA